MWPRISIIAAIGKETRVLGKAGQLLWHIPGDLPRFKALTMGHPIIMGRKTYESIGRALPGRTNIVITRNPDFKPEGVVVVSSIETALGEAKKVEQAKPSPAGSPDVAEATFKEIFIIGGGEIYTQALPFTNRLYLTLVDDPAEGDTFFPDYSEFTKVISRELGTGEPPHEFVTLER